ncbi:MAG: hypothetical protein IJU92_04925 [Spirochaetaceae bacterium]|nr:hypothetical protein [Spirochaetaceae bacterium]
MTLRKNITIEEEDFLTISQHCKKVGKTLSEFLREAALDIIAKQEQLDLYDYLNKNISFVSAQEQREFDELDLDFETTGKALTLDDIL